MIGEGEPLGAANGQDKLGQAKEAVRATTERVKATTQAVTDAIEAGRQPGAPLDRLAGWTREAPLHSMAVALLIGFILGSRRR